MGSASFKSSKPPAVVKQHGLFFASTDPEQPKTTVAAWFREHWRKDEPAEVNTLLTPPRGRSGGIRINDLYYWFVAWWEEEEEVEINKKVYTKTLFEKVVKEMVGPRQTPTGAGYYINSNKVYVRGYMSDVYTVDTLPTPPSTAST